ncbi:BatD family protein [Aliiglaciecola sp.]|nr:BatD family protein [Aliiglaciecola sp.]
MKLAVSKNNMVIKLMTLILLAFSFVTHAQVASVNANVDKNPAMADESIVLSVVAIGDADPSSFDPSSLSDNFFVGRTSTSTQTRVINFNTTRSTSWTTILIPRRQGTFDIPSFNIGGKQTEPITVRVIPASAGSPGKAREAFVTTSVDIQQPYVQQLITYTVKIHLAVELQRGSLANPQIENAEIKKLGDDKEYSDIVDGQRYRIIERRYGIIPQASGDITVKGPLFEAEIIDRSRNSFSYFNQTRPINRVAPDVALTVKPIPPSFNEHWLPSEYVQLNEEWQPALSEIKAGEPITRTLTLSVLGVAEEQLPQITGIYPPDFKIYPDQATTASVVKDGNLIAQRVENIAIIPNRAGQFVLPPVKVAWFNTRTQKMEFAQIPAKSIAVAPSTTGTTTVPLSTPPAPITDDSSAQITDNTLSPTIKTVEVATFWSASSWLLLGMWILTVFAWYWHANRNPQKAPRVKMVNQTEKDHWKQLKSVAKNGKPGDIHAAIETWKTCITDAGERDAGEPINWQQYANLHSQIEIMFASEYAQGSSSWKSESLIDELEQVRKRILNQHKQATQLPPLYQ